MSMSKMLPMMVRYSASGRHCKPVVLVVVVNYPEATLKNCDDLIFFSQSSKHLCIFGLYGAM